MKILLLKICKEITMRQSSEMEGSMEESRYKLPEMETSLACAIGIRNAGVIGHRNKE